MSIFSPDLHEPQVIDLINKRYGGILLFEGCPPLTGADAPGRHHWVPDTSAENQPLENGTFYSIKSITYGIAKSYQELVRQLKLKPNYIEGYIWAISKAHKWGLIAVKSELISSFELWGFIIKLSIHLVFSKYEIIHGNITGLHVYIVRNDKLILMTPNRFVTRPRGSELIRAWCWYIAKGHEDGFISLLKTEKNKLIVNLWLLGAIFDCINDPEYYRGDPQEIASLWRKI